MNPSAIPIRTPTRLADLPIAVRAESPDGTLSETWRKTLVDESTDHAVFYVQFAPGEQGEPHWHPSDTLYVFERGSLIVEGEATYRAGEIRFVNGGFAYGAEVGGPEGCTFIFISLGPYGRFDPDVDPAPAGRWDEPQPTP